MTCSYDYIFKPNKCKYKDSKYKDMLAGIETLNYLKYQSHLECCSLTVAMNKCPILKSCVIIRLDFYLLIFNWYLMETWALMSIWYQLNSFKRFLVHCWSSVLFYSKDRYICKLCRIIFLSGLFCCLLKIDNGIH